MDDQADRELTYCDPEAETVTDAEEGLPSEKDAARFLLHLWDRAPGWVHHRQAVERLREEWGGQFICLGREGFQVGQEVRERFLSLAGREVVWDAQDRAWRWRYSWGR